MTLRSQLMIGLIATAIFPIISFAADTATTTNTTRIYSETEIASIHSMNCDSYTSETKNKCLDLKKSALSQSTTATVDISSPLMKIENESNHEHMLPISNSGDTTPKPPKLPIGSGTTNERLLLPTVQKRGGDENTRIVSGGFGAGPHVRMMKDGTDIEYQMHGLGIAFGKLSPTDRSTLIKMIRDYLTSKGLTLEVPEVKKDETKRQGWDGSIKGNKIDTKIQAERAALLAKREAMKKEYIGHVTIVK